MIAESCQTISLTLLHVSVVHELPRATVGTLQPPTNHVLFLCEYSTQHMCCLHANNNTVLIWLLLYLFHTLRSISFTPKEERIHLVACITLLTILLFSHKYFLRKMNSTTSSQVFVKLRHTGGERPFCCDHDGELQHPQIRQRHPIPVQEYKHQHCHLCHLHVCHCHQPGRKWPLHVDPHLPYLPQDCLHHLHD